MSKYIGFKTPPKFFDNWDGMHCGECCIRSIIEHFESETKVSLEEIDNMSGKVEGKATWPQKLSVEMMNRGYELVNIGLFSTEEMLEEGIENYLIKTQGKEAADWSVRNSIDLSIIEKDCYDYIQHPKYEYVQRLPTIEDIKRHLTNECLIISMINSCALNKKEGYAGHFVLIYGIDDDYIYFHDSNIDARPQRKETHEFFIKAACSPTPENWDITAYKKAL